MKLYHFLYCFILLLITACSYKRELTAENIQVSPLYSSGMVLQTDPHTIIHGYADPESILAVKIMEFVKIVKADSIGKWEAVFPRMLLRKPFDLAIEGRDTTIIIPKIRAGKVILFLGDARLNVFDNYHKTHCEYADSVSNSSVWIFNHEYSSSQEGEISFSGKWIPVKEVTGNSKTCNAIKWFYKLFGNSRIPVGIIDATWPAARVDTWLNRDISQPKNDSTTSAAKVREINISFNSSLADSIEFLKRTSYDGIKAGASRIWYNDDSWRITDLPVDFTDKDISLKKRIIYLRKKIYISSRYLTSNFTLNLGYIKGEAEFYFNQEKILPEITEGYYRLTLSDSILHEWSNLLCIRLFCLDEHSGLYGPSFTCQNADSTFYETVDQDWKYNYSLEPDFPDFNSITSETGILYTELIEGIRNHPMGELIWYGGYFDLEDPNTLAEKTEEIMGYFSRVKQRSVLFTPFIPLDSILYNNNTEIVKHELEQAAKNRDAKWIEYDSDQ